MNTLERIVVPLAAGGPGQRAVRVATALAGAAGAELVFLHVVQRGAHDSDELPAAKEEGMRLLDTAAEIAGSHGVSKVSKDLVVTEESDLAAELAKQSKSASLVVMATAGRSGLTRLVIGSVCESFLGVTHCPVVTCREAEEDVAIPNIASLLIGHDGSETSERAILAAGTVAQAVKGKVTVLSVTPTFMDPVLGDSASNQIARNMHHQNKKALEKAQTLLEGVETQLVDRETIEGPELALVEESQKHDMVVVGTHGHRGITRLFLGSVAIDLVRTSSKPVMVVPPARD